MLMGPQPPRPFARHMAWRPRSLRLNARTIRTQARYDHKPRHDLDDHIQRSAFATPRQLVQYLDEFVVGQESAKKVLSVA